ncbi:MAG: hypothetical protein ACXVCY_00105 [Pseudobdellovibrionaceae bacterium]
MKTIYLIFALFLSSAMITGCGKDQNLEDYKKKLLDQDLAQFNAVSGRYSGYVKSNKDKKTPGLVDKNLGALEITLRTTTQVVNPQDGSKSNAQPLLIASIVFQGESRMSIVGQNCYYDYNSGKFQITIPVTNFLNLSSNSNGAASSAVISLNGLIKNGVMTGSLEAMGFSDYGATFSLSQQGASLESLVQASKPESNIIFLNARYSGTTVFANSNVSKKVDLVILKPQTTSENDFLNLLIPVKPVQITLNYGNGARLLFADGNWNQQTGLLTGHTDLSFSSTSSDGSTSVQTGTLSLTCKQNASGPAFDCSIVTSSSSGAKASIHVDLNQNPSSENGPDDSSTTRDPIIRAYFGEMIVDSDTKVPTSFNVIYPARSRMEEIVSLYYPQAEKLLQINFTFGNPKIGLSFLKVKWDTVKGTLDGIQSTTINGQAVTATISCENFHFQDEDNYSFSCQYITTLRNSYAELRFKSK